MGLVRHTLESRASEYLHNNIPFSAIRIDDVNKREDFETMLIATLAGTEDFKPSRNWLGLDSPEDVIRTSGMWLKQGINGNRLCPDDLKELIRIIDQTMK